MESDKIVVDPVLNIDLSDTSILSNNDDWWFLSLRTIKLVFITAAVVAAALYFGPWICQQISAMYVRCMKVQHPELAAMEEGIKMVRSRRRK